MERNDRELLERLSESRHGLLLEIFTDVGDHFAVDAQDQNKEARLFVILQEVLELVVVVVNKESSPASSSQG